MRVTVAKRRRTKEVLKLVHELVDTRALENSTVLSNISLDVDVVSFLTAVCNKYLVRHSTKVIPQYCNQLIKNTNMFILCTCDLILELIANTKDNQNIHGKHFKPCGLNCTYERILVVFELS